MECIDRGRPFAESCPYIGRRLDWFHGYCDLMERNAFTVVAGYGDGGMGPSAAIGSSPTGGGYEQTYSLAGPSGGLMREVLGRLLEGE